MEALIEIMLDHVINFEFLTSLKKIWLKSTMKAWFKDVLYM